MRIAYLSSAKSIHTFRWVSALAARGHEMVLYSMEPPVYEFPVEVRTLPVGGPMGYFLSARSVRAGLKAWKPDLVHAHYATGYGTLARLVGIRPWILSVWGSDVYEFPFQSSWRRRLLGKNLRAATAVFSTGVRMAEFTKRLYPSIGEIGITPFGVDTSVFRPIVREPNEPLVVGTAKTLEWRYGIDLLLQAFAQIDFDVRLLIVGDGPDRAKYETLVTELGIADRTSFAGAKPHNELPNWLNRFDIYVAPSRIESFGVAVIEASACRVPVVVSDVGGLPEVVDSGVTGEVVAAEDLGSLAAAITKLLCDSDLRLRYGSFGRQFVQANFEWSDCVDRMERLYLEVAAQQ